MKKHIALVFNILAIPAMLLHEASHGLFALLMYPFKSRIKAVDISVKIYKGECVYRGNVITYSHYASTSIIISIAPLITWGFILAISFAYYPILYFYAAFFCMVFTPSVNDWQNIFFALGLSEGHDSICNEQEIDELMNGKTKSISSNTMVMDK